MAEPLFHSMHLEGLPRREEFRSARAKIEANCGQATLYGDLGLLESGQVGDGLTVQYAQGDAKVFCVQDGDSVHPLNVGINSIGRLPDNSVVIRDECVSRRHCAIVIHQNGACELYDVASKNGTILNGRRIQGSTVIRPGDRISLCARQIVFLAQATPQAKSAEPIE